MKMENISMPENTLIPVLAYPNIEEAISWLNKMFGFTLRLKIGSHRAQINVTDHFAFAITKDESYKIIDSKNSIMIRISDIDKHFSQVQDLKGEIISKPTNYAFGERQYSVKDYAGHIWTFSQTISNEKPETWGGKSINL